MSIRTVIKSLTPSGLRPEAYAARELNRIRSSNRILGGPFRGMDFSWERWDENFTLPVPKFIGCYERELHPWIERVIALKPDVIVDIGAADGYYAVGLALRIPEATVVAFEEIEAGQELVSKIARVNGVHARVQSLGRCEASELRLALGVEGSTFVMCDIEGYEGVLMDPAVVPELERATMLIEAHDCFVPDVSTLIQKRFQDSHVIESIGTRVRSADDVECVSSFLRSYAKVYVNGWTEERLFDTEWLYLAPRS